MRVLCLLVVLCIVAACAGDIAPRRPSIKRFAQERGAFDQLNKAAAFVKRGFKIAKQHDLADMTVECVLCGIAVNEIEGMMAENLTLQAIEDALEQRVCTLVPAMQQYCDDLVKMLPYIVNKIEAAYTVSAVCIDLKFCDKPFTPYVDPEPVPTYVINLDLPPQQRWTDVCSIGKYKDMVSFLIDSVNAILPDHGQTLEDLGTFVNQYYYPTEFAQEIVGCANAMGVSAGWLTLFNLGYEVSDACTSIVAQTTDGTILHARNMDFWEGMVFTDSLKNITFMVDWQKGGKTVFISTSFAGYVGVLSGMKPGAFSVTIDTRFYPEGLGQLFYEIVAALEETNASLVSFLSREVLTNENDFKAALAQLSDDTLIADVYYILAGVGPGEGAVVSRNRLNATDVWLLDSPSRWFEVQTNYDHWTQPPWFDDRVVPANDAMKAMGQDRVTLQGMYGALSVKPVLNLQTTYTMLAVPKNGSYSTVTRWCPYPCVE